MKLPSINQVVRDARRTFARFPFVIFDAAVGTAAALVLIDYEGPPGPTVLFPVLFAAILGIPLLTALALMAEKKKWGSPIELGAQVVGVILLVAYAFSVPLDIIDGPAIDVIRLLILAAALHLFVALAPFTGRGEVNGFWHYNKTLFLKLLTALLYTVVLYAGLSLALAALDNLFGIHVPGKRYGELWVLLNGLFTTWYFLAGVPGDLDGLDALTDYPKGLKIFAQYILFPLVLIYVAILYAYLAKILVSWDWPQGWVSKLILGFSGTGIFSLLLLHPISGRTENVWIKTTSKWFYVVMIPLIVMLFFAVWRRVSEYGFTEGRYLAIALGVWLVVLVCYFIFSKTKSIKLIPATLCVASFVVSFGSWGAFSVSEKSQINRLEQLLAKDAILVKGAVHKDHPAVPYEDAKQISSILAYLHDIHGYAGIQPWFSKSLKLYSDPARAVYTDPASVAKMMDIEYVRFWMVARSGYVFFSADRGKGLELNGYDRVIHASQIYSNAAGKDFQGQDLSYRVSDDMKEMTISLLREGKVADTLRLDFRSLVDSLVKDYSGRNTDRIPPEKMVVSNATSLFKVKVFLWQIRTQREGDQTKVVYFDADVFYAIAARH